ncbi:GntR family transcriptional regulator [Bosea sp. PAMC 26642]|uniref:GntR family transcriptional regulator n=1 Tax=Bosea sp. (strain PAMC 26642) TaxID=1792307 RepID=UPI001F18581D|nr:GntR family transcriptional regulator [Bosea sp. PAMC 26642]
MADQIFGQEAPGPLRSERRPQRRGMAAPTRSTAASVVQDALRQAILAMQIPPGSALVEKDLTARFGLSRTPVREALIKLREEGLVEVFPQAGTFVARIPVEAIPEAVFIRQALECATVELVAGIATPEIIAGLDAVIARQHVAFDDGDQERFHLEDEVFHETLAMSAGYPGIWKLAQAAKSQIDRCRRMTLPVPGRMAMVIREHLSIVDAVRRRDGPAAQAAMRKHLGTLLPDLLHLRATHPDYFA